MAEEQAAPTTEPSSTETAATERPLSLLASEMFGSSYKGEVKQPEQPAESPEEGASEDEQAAPEEPQGEPEQEEASSETPLSSVTELVEHFELDPEWFDNLQVADLKIDGQPTQATLKELKASYQMQKAAENRLEQAKEKAKEIVQAATQKNEQMEAQFAAAAKIIENAQSMLDKDVKNVNWEKLREDDPAEYSAKKAEIAERREQIEQMKREGAEEYQKWNQQRQAEQQQALQEHLEKEHAALLEHKPEWRDEEKAKAGKAKLAEYLMSQGFSQQDVMGASDHRLILMADKARLYDELQANTNAAKKKVAKVPKVLKPGAPKSQEQVNQKRIDEQRAKLRQSGKIDDAFALLKARRGGK